MLGIPFLNKFIEKTVKRQKVADSVDYLNYYVTTLLLAFFALAISAKQYFGSPIQCWVPSEFKGGWEKYAEDYCFIANSYYVPFDEEIPGELHHRQDHVSYYRWVPIMLALQAFMFFVPNWLWNMIHKQTAINPRAFLNEAEKVRFLTGDSRDKELSSLANYFMETVSVFGGSTMKKRYRTTPRSGCNAMWLYLLTKAGYVANILIQMIILNHFLGESYINWGYQVASNIMKGHEWEETPVFPRVIMCDFQIRRLGNIQRHTVQCVIMMNMINEKLYLFLYFWFIMLGIVTLVNFFYYIIVMLVPQLRARLVLFNFDSNKHHRGIPRQEMSRFVYECLHPDGVLLLQFLREHVGGRITFDLINKLLAIYAQQDNFSDDSIDKHPHSPIEKYSRPPHYGNYGPLPTNKVFYPSLNSNSVRDKTFESSAPALENYMDHGTMKIGEKTPLQDQQARSSPTDV